MLTAGAADWRFPVLVFLAWRLVHAAVLALVGGSQLEAAVAFDGAYYRHVLRDGYTVPVDGYSAYSDVAFFPGLAWVTWPVALVVRDEGTALLLTANALALAAFVGVWLAVRAWTDDLRLAQRVVVGLALLPTSYFLWSYYAEALLVASVSFAAWAARRDRTALVLPLLALAATGRVVGVAAGVVLAIARVIEQRRLDLTAMCYVTASAAGFGAVLLTHAQQSGDPFAWSAAQEAWGREPAAPWTPAVDAVSRLVQRGDVAWGAALNLGTAAGVGVLLLALLQGWRRGAWPAAPVGLAAAFWLAPLCSRLISSQVRFALLCWPALLPVALAWPRLPRWIRAGLVLTSLLGTVVLLDRLADGQFTA